MTGVGLPASQADVVAVVTVLARAARWDPGDAAGRARDLWARGVRSDNYRASAQLLAAGVMAWRGVACQRARDRVRCVAFKGWCG